MFRILPVAACILLIGCETNQPVQVVAPDAKSVILQHKGRIWKDPDSIKNASITPVRRHLGLMWHVCVRANAKNAFGGYTGEKEMLIGLYDDGRPPEALAENAIMACEMPHEPFPELEGDYRSVPSGPRATNGNKRSG